MNVRGHKRRQMEQTSTTLK